MNTIRLLPPLFVVACSTEPVELTTTPTDAVDVRVTDADLGALGPDQVVLTGGEYVVQPGEDVMFCSFGTYDGPDAGMHEIRTHQGVHGHHFVLMGTTTPTMDAPDGTVVDCTTTEGSGVDMTSLEPLGLPNVALVDGVAAGPQMPLPEGMAVELESGQRYVLQSHYLNTTSEPMLVQDKVVITTMPTESVETWVAPLVFNRDDFSVPPGGDLTTSFECEASADWNVLYMIGHMHEWGTAFSVTESGASSPLYEVPQWDPVYRDAPMVLDWTSDPMPMPLGSRWTTTCSWTNDEDEPLEFPHEMCVTVSFVYPQKTTVVCDGNGQ